MTKTQVTFTVGMNAKLKSGGPVMTVESVDGDSVTCIWFDKAHLSRSTFFADTILRHTDIVDLLKSVEEAAKNKNK